MEHIYQYDEFVNEALFPISIKEIKENIKKITNKENLKEYLGSIFDQTAQSNKRARKLFISTILTAFLSTSAISLSLSDIKEVASNSPTEIKELVENEIVAQSEPKSEPKLVDNLGDEKLISEPEIKKEIKSDIGSRIEYFSLLGAQESGHRDTLGNPIPGTSDWKKIQWQRNKKTKERYPAYIGKYQFGNIALVDVGKCKNYADAKKFKKEFAKNPEIWPEYEQELAMKKLVDNNKRYLRNYTNYIGKTINNIEITEAGLIAASHLVGNGKVKKFLKSDGEKIAKDGNGVPLTKYLSMFSKFDLNT